MNEKNNYIIISLGGSLIVPSEVDWQYLRKFKKLIESRVKNGQRFVIVAGGGQTCRRYNKAALKISGKKVKTIDLDWMGIRATYLNAELLRTIFGDLAYKEVITNPTLPIKTEKPIIIGCGWQPGCSSDMDAVLLAQNFSAKVLLNLSNVDYIYDKDPKKFSDAKPYKNLTWEQILKIVKVKWQPGLNIPFEYQSAKLAKSLGLKLIMASGQKIKNLSNIFSGKKFDATVIE